MAEAEIGSALANGIISGENCRPENPKGVWFNIPPVVGIWFGVLRITVAGVASRFSALFCRPLLDVASLVGGGVCICEKSILGGRMRERRLSDKPAADRFAKLGSGEDDSLRNGSTGGSERLLGAKWLIWNSGSSGERTF